MPRKQEYRTFVAQKLPWKFTFFPKKKINFIVPDPETMSREAFASRAYAFRDIIYTCSFSLVASVKDSKLFHNQEAF